MLNKICVLIHKPDQFIPTLTYLKHGIIIFIISPELPIQHIFDLLYKQNPSFSKHTKFSLGYDVQQAVTNFTDLESDADYNDFLINIAFHPAFYGNLNKPHIFYFNSSSVTAAEKVVRLHNHLRQKLLAQSFSEVLFHEIDQKRYLTLKETTSKEDFKVLENFYRDIFLYQGIYNQHIFISSPLTTVFENLENKILAVENEFRMQQPLLFKQMQELKLITDENQQLFNKLSIYKEQSENYKKYLELIQSQDETGNILKFYKYEYEILPLWYKQLGHIIKVLQGKRTLKSLFNNNVKKYLD